MKKQLLSVVIPCYRSEHTIGNVVREMTDTLATREEEFDYEIILVNDGSPDGLTTTILELCKQNPKIVFVNLSRNFGQHSALMAGFSRVRGDIVICLDDDGQTPANECFKLVDKVLEGYDIVFAEYPHRQQDWFRNLGSHFNALCNQYFFSQPRSLHANSYYACLRFVVDAALLYPNPFPYVTGLLFQSVKTYANVPVCHRARYEGESGYTLKTLIKLWLNGVTSFSIKPLRFANYLGWLTALFGFLFALIIIVRKLLNPEMQTGWSSTMALMLFLGGITIALIGIVGEYIGRIYLSINRQPQYVVRDVLDRRDGAMDDDIVIARQEGGNVPLEHHSRDLGT